MNVNQTLDLLRRLCEQPAGTEVCEEFQALFSDLDDRLSNKQPLPDDWAAARRRF